MVFMRKIIFSFSLFSIFFLPSSGYAGKPLEKEIEQLVSGEVKPYMESTQIPGAAVGVFYKGKSYFFNYGSANKKRGGKNKITEDTLFSLGSITKTFAGTLLGQSVVQGRCSLDDPMISCLDKPMINYLPDLLGTEALPIGAITLRQLAIHTSSLPRNSEDFGVSRLSPTAKQELWPKLVAWEPTVPIGAQWIYSNLGVHLLEEALGNIFGNGFPAAFDANVTSVLGMNDTVVEATGSQVARFAQGYDANGQPITYQISTDYLGGGGTYLSTARDMMAYMRANLKDPNLNIPQDLSYGIDIAQAPYLQINGNFWQRLTWTSILLQGQETIQKSGGYGGFLSYMAFIPDPAYKMGIVILVNQGGNSPVAIARSILSKLIIDNPA